MKINLAYIVPTLPAREEKEGEPGLAERWNGVADGNINGFVNHVHDAMQP